MAYHHPGLRKRLIAEGLKLLARDGLSALSLRKLAKKASVSHTAPARHFKNREGLLVALSQEGFEELLRLGQTSIAKQKDPADAFAAYGLVYVQFAAKNPELFRLMFSSTEIDWKKYPEFCEVSEKSFQLLVDSAAKLPKSKKIKPEPFRTAVAAWAFVHGISFLLTDGRLDRGSGDPTPAEIWKWLQVEFGSFNQ